jgi:hypothetical protein
VNKEEFMDEYLNRLAFSLAQMWPFGEELPDEEAKEDEIYYKVVIRRLSFINRASLAKRVRRLCLPKVNFFAKCVPQGDRVKLIDGIFERFPQLKAAEHDAVILSDRI